MIARPADLGHLFHERDVLLDVLREVRMEILDLLPHLAPQTQDRVRRILARYE